MGRSHLPQISACAIQPGRPQSIANQHLAAAIQHSVELTYINKHLTPPFFSSFKHPNRPPSTHIASIDTFHDYQHELPVVHPAYRSHHPRQTLPVGPFSPMESRTSSPQMAGLDGSNRKIRYSRAQESPPGRSI
jgi:hypothetical protein